MSINQPSGHIELSIDHQNGYEVVQSLAAFGIANICHPSF